jgi:hypothetical protein
VKQLFAETPVAAAPAVPGNQEVPAAPAPPSATAPAEPALVGEANSTSEPPAPKEPTKRPAYQEKKRRVLEIKGGVLKSQDGVTMRFRKKCIKCGYDDRNTTTMPIRPGSMNLSFFCPKCRRSQRVQIQSV